MTTFRLRKGYSGVTGPYIICDQDGYPLYDVPDLKTLNREIKSIKTFNTLIDERKIAPSLEGIPGNSVYEKIYYCRKRFENSIRFPRIFGYMRIGKNKSGNEDLENRLTEAGAEEIRKEPYTQTSKSPCFDELNKVLKQGDTLIISKLNQIARSVSQGTEQIDDLIRRGVKIKILNMGNFIIDSNRQDLLQIFKAFSEFENDIAIERMQNGRILTGHKGGRPRIAQDKINYAMELLKTNSYSDVAEKTGISKSTLQRAKRLSNTHQD